MKKLSTYLFLLLFSFQTSSWADDIRDFQIEGMSVGDSLLDYFSKEEIENFFKAKNFYIFIILTDITIYKVKHSIICNKDYFIFSFIPAQIYNILIFVHYNDFR